MTDEEQQLRDKIAAKERTIARIGDEWLSRVLRQDINALRQQLKKLTGK